MSNPLEPQLAPVAPDLVWFDGPDAIRFLNDLIAQEIADMEVGEVRRSLLLNARGRIDHVLWVLRGEEFVGLVTDPGRGPLLAATLGRYRIRVDVGIEEAAGAWLVVGPSELEPATWSGDRGALSADVSWTGVTRTLGLGERPELPTMSMADYEGLRIIAGEPLAGIDVDDDTIPQETGLVPSGVDFDKGCFLGQELVARLHNRGGRVNRHLRILRFELAAPGVGAAVLADGAEVGTVTSAAGNLGLARLQRDVEPGTAVVAGSVSGVVEAVP